MHKMCLLLKSNVTPGDFVGSVLGNQGAGINNSENVGKAMLEGVISSPRLFGIGDPSPHSYYPCVIGCGNENYTSDKNNYYTPNKLDVNGKPQSPITDYYKENFMVKDKNGDTRMSIDLNLLPSNNKPNIKNNNQVVDLKNIKGSK